MSISSTIVNLVQLFKGILDIRNDFASTFGKNQFWVASTSHLTEAMKTEMPSDMLAPFFLDGKDCQPLSLGDFQNHSVIITFSDGHSVALDRGSV